MDGNLSPTDRVAGFAAVGQADFLESYMSAAGSAGEREITVFGPPHRMLFEGPHPMI